MSKKFDSDYVLKHALISYRASDKDQKVRIHTRWAAADESAANFLRFFDAPMREGFAGDATISPIEGHAEFIAAPHLDGNLGPISELDAVLRVRSVSEFYLRYLVEMLIPDHLELSVVGELPIDDGPQSVSTHSFLERTDDPLAFPGVWPEIPFELERDEASRGASLRVFFAGTVPNDYATGPVGIGVRMPALAGIVMNSLWNQAGDQAGVVSMMPKIKIGKTEASVLWDSFAVHPDAFTNILINHLIWVHHREIPIEKVEIRTS
jgi:hypothetical protein